MIGIVVVTHCQLGAALLEAAQFVLRGPIEGAVPVSVDLTQSADTLRKNIADAIKKVDDREGVLVLTDMFGGTPSNLGYSFLREERVEVVTGVNLPILLRASSMRQKMGLKALASEMEAYGKNSICLASGILKGNKSSGA